MANLKPYYNKDGKLVAYYIRVFRGRDPNGKQLKPYGMTFNVNPKWTPEKALEEAKKAAILFEADCKNNKVASDKRKFSEYAARVIDLKHENGTLKQSTYERYQEFLERINPEIGNLRIDKITTAHLNDLYQKLLNTPVKNRSMVPNQLVMDILSGEVISFPAAGSLRVKKGGKGISNETLAAAAGTSPAVISKVRRGKSIKSELAEAIALTLGYENTTDLFTETRESVMLDKKTVLEHHQLISGVLRFAVETEHLLPTNVASSALKPKIGRKKDQRFYEPEEIRLIMETIVDEPLHWRILLYICMYTGCRRGEALGLRFSDVEIQKQRIRIYQELLYSRELGLYIQTPKTDDSARWIGIPPDLTAMLVEYMQDMENTRIFVNDNWADSDLIFINHIGRKPSKAKGEDPSEDKGGNPFHPDSFTKWCGTLNKKYKDTGIPHINPHAFRHSYASALINTGRDVKSVQHQLGHATAQTTTNIYSHFYKSAVEVTADDILNAYGDIVTKKEE